MLRVFLPLFLLAHAGLAQNLRVGTASVILTPPAGMPMAGYYSTRLSTGVHDDLHAKAIVLSTGPNQTAAFVACDLIGLPPEVIDEARALIQAATGIRGARVMITATHSHTGPLIPSGGMRDAYGGRLEIARRYRAELPAKIAESVKLAEQRMVPARASFARGQQDGVSFNRRFFMKDGSVGWNPGKMNPNIVKPAGPIDPDVPVVLFEALGGQALATYVNFALHLDTVGGLDVSADYPFTLSSRLAQAKGEPMLTMFAIGAAGNINHLDVKSSAPQKGPDEARRIGDALAETVLGTYRDMQRIRPNSGVQTASTTVTIDPARIEPGDRQRAEAFVKQMDSGTTMKFLDTVFAFKVLDALAQQGKPYTAEVQVIALGDQVAWVALPGEVFTELGTAIKRSSPFPLTIVTELGHGPVTYFPNQPAFPQGNYEVVTSRAAPGSGEKLVKAAEALLQQTFHSARR